MSRCSYIGIVGKFGHLVMVEFQGKI